MYYNVTNVSLSHSTVKIPKYRSINNYYLLQRNIIYQNNWMKYDDEADISRQKEFDDNFTI